VQQPGDTWQQLRVRLEQLAIHAPDHQLLQGWQASGHVVQPCVSWHSSQHNAIKLQADEARAARAELLQKIRVRYGNILQAQHAEVGAGCSHAMSCSLIHNASLQAQPTQA
jgi:hypothetical protein